MAMNSTASIVARESLTGRHCVPTTTSEAS